MPTTHGYLTRIEAAERAHVHPRTITRWITEGHLTKHPGRRGRRPVTLISAEELDKLTATTPITTGA